VEIGSSIYKLISAVESLYIMKSLLNKFYLKKQHHDIHMKECFCPS